MTIDKQNLHWSAVIGVAFSFWLLIWLILIVATLSDIKVLNSTQPQIASVMVNEPNTNVTTGNSGQKSFMVLAGVFVLWLAYRARKRLDLLRNGELFSAQIFREKREAHDYNSGSTNIVVDCFYRYQVDGERYSNTILWTFGLKGKKSIDIVYSTRNPNYSAIVSRLRARFNPEANEWLSPMWHVIPRLLLLVIIVIGIVTLLFSDTPLLS
jgi:hypothetical protein